MRSLGDQLRAHQGFGPGFNFARIFLAYSVLVWHTVAIAENGADQALRTGLWPLIFAILPMFFALSGFLVTGSALRLPLKEYILNRTFRIVPALGVDIAISALIIGPIFTTVALPLYFTDPDFWSYSLNIVGKIHYELPGVFEANPYAGVVNGALWTVPYEIACYVVMSSMIFVGIVRSWKWTIGFAVILVATAITCHLLGFGKGSGLVDKGIRFAFLAKGASLVPSFLVGAALYLMKDRIPYSGFLALCVGLGIIALGVWGEASLYYNPVFIGLVAFPLAYLVVWIGLTPIPIPKLLESGDYSYGIYLYHFPILQALEHMFGFTSWWALAFAGLLPVTLFAIFSWHTIEKPTLKMRSRFSLVGARLAPPHLNSVTKAITMQSSGFVQVPTLLADESKKPPATLLGGGG
ncbi:MAG: acyltransferase 3 [Cypionkella sp.]|nr:acyltransferase 3 [Cypionkella sp.]